MTTNGNAPHEDDNGPETSRSPSEMPVAVRIEILGQKIDAAVLDVRSMRTEIHAFGGMLQRIWEAVGGMVTRLDQSETEVTQIKATVFGMARKLAHTIDTMNQLTNIVNRAHPEEDDVEVITKTDIRFEKIVDAKLTKHELEQAKTTIAKHADRKEWLTRQTMLWIMAAFGFVCVTVISVLITLLIKR